MAPVVMTAFEVYRRRQESREAAQGNARDSASPEALRKRIQDLENADVEQARLVSDLSSTVEALAASLDKEIEEGKQRTTRLQRQIVVAYSLCAVIAGAVIWLMVRGS